MSNPAARLEELESQLRTRRAAREERINSLLRDGNDLSLPSFNSLKEERQLLQERIRHSKDEGEAIIRDLEAHDGACDIFRVAARIKCAEAFAARAEKYVLNDLAGEIENVIESDKRHSEDEVAAHITQLQAKREDEIKKIAALKERTRSQSEGIRNGPRVDRNARDGRYQNAQKKEKQNKEDVKTIAFTDEQRGANAELYEKVKTLRQEKSKLQVAILDEKHRNEKKISELNTRIRQAELTNKSDARRCTELNTSNATLTTNAQILMGQLNTEHYGTKGAITQKQMIKEREKEKKADARRRRRARRAAREAAEQNGAAYEEEEEEKENNNYNNNNEEKDKSEVNEAQSGVSSRRPSLSKPPLVAIKTTAAQKNREAAVKAEHEQKLQEENSVQRFHRRESDASASAARPPRVASVQTESSRNKIISQENSISSKRDF